MNTIVISMVECLLDAVKFSRLMGTEEWIG